MLKKTKLNIFCALLFIVEAFNPAFAKKVSVSNNGKAVLPIIAKNNENSMKQAKILAEYLHKISGARFSIDNAGKKGIFLGLSKDFPKFEKLFDVENPFRSDDYLIKSVAGSIYLVGVSDIALEHAVWSFLYHLGYRQFFPTQNWEIIPHKENIAVAINIFEKPDYYVRSIFFGYGSWTENMKRFKQWKIKNRLNGRCQLNTGHIYHVIIQQNKDEFKKHPEYYGLYKKKCSSHKICVSNSGVQKLALKYAKDFFLKYPEQITVSMTPTDGDKWCECEKCAKINSITDRVALLSNYVADGLRNDPRFKNKYVGMLAYYDYSPPPSKKLAPNVIVCIATSYIHGGCSFKELLDRWREKADFLGVYDYFSVTMNDRSNPGIAKGSDIDYLSHQISEAYCQKARFYIAECGDNWGPCGLGYYIASQLFWDANPTKTGIWEKDFYDKAFGPAAKTMKQFYELISRENAVMLSEDLIGRMYGILAEAMNQTSSRSAISKRIDDLVLYTHYVELFQKYTSSKGVFRQAEFEKMLKFAYRIRNTMMVDSMALYKDTIYRDKNISIPENAKWSIPELNNPWKNSSRFSPKEIKEILDDGIEKNIIIEYKKNDYGFNFVPFNAAPNHRENPLLLSGKYQFYLWAEDEKLPAITVACGVVSQNGKVAEWELCDADGKVIETGKVPATNKAQLLVFKPCENGLYLFKYNDRGMFSKITWSVGSKVCLLADEKNKPRIYGSSCFHFYVPKGIKKVVLYMSQTYAHIFDSNMREVLAPTKKKNQIVEIPVEPDQGGKIWNIQGVCGTIILKNIPPLLALSENELLIPKHCSQKENTK